MRASVGAFQSLDLQYNHVPSPDERGDGAAPIETAPPLVCRWVSTLKVKKCKPYHTTECTAYSTGVQFTVFLS